MLRALVCRDEQVARPGPGQARPTPAGGCTCSRRSGIGWTATRTCERTRRGPPTLARVCHPLRRSDPLRHGRCAQPGERQHRVAASAFPRARAVGQAVAPAAGGAIEGRAREPRAPRGAQAGGAFRLGRAATVRCTPAGPRPAAGGCAKRRANNAQSDLAPRRRRTPGCAMFRLNCFIKGIYVDRRRLAAAGKHRAARMQISWQNNVALSRPAAYSGTGAGAGTAP